MGTIIIITEPLITIETVRGNDGSSRNGTPPARALAGTTLVSIAFVIGGMTLRRRATLSSP